jgi:hypothetical protein
MHPDDTIILTTRGDPPAVPLAEVARHAGVDPAQVVRWAWVGRIPPPTQVGRRWLWRRSEALSIRNDGPALPGFYLSLPHYDGIRMLDACRHAAPRGRRSPGRKRGGAA